LGDFTSKIGSIEEYAQEFPHRVLTKDQASRPNIRPQGTTNSAGQIQCRECGVWQSNLTHHIKKHDHTNESYMDKYHQAPRIAPIFRENASASNTEEVKQAKSEASHAMWDDPEKRDEISSSIKDSRSTPEARQQASEHSLGYHAKLNQDMDRKTKI